MVVLTDGDLTDEDEDDLSIRNTADNLRKQNIIVYGVGQEIYKEKLVD